ncbi:hypothetical protein ACOSQ3_022668 [Xanthoceras sorbifolium]
MLQSVDRASSINDGATRDDRASSAAKGLIEVVVDEGLARGCYLWHKTSKVLLVFADFFSVWFLVVFFRSSPITFVGITSPPTTTSFDDDPFVLISNEPPPPPSNNDDFFSMNFFSTRWNKIFNLLFLFFHLKGSLK